MQNYMAILFIFLTQLTIVQGQGNTLSVSCPGFPQINEIPVRAVEYLNEYPSKKEQFWNNWSRGCIFYSSGKQSSQVTLRYNSWKDELIWLRTSDYKTGTVIRGFVNSFMVYEGTDTLKFIHYTDSQLVQKPDMYLQVLAEGRYSVYCYRKVTLLKGDDKFVKRHQYLLKSEGNLYKFKPRKSQLLSLFPKSKQKDIKDLLRSHHLDISNDIDLAQAIRLINQLDENRTN